MVHKRNECLDALLDLIAADLINCEVAANRIGDVLAVGGQCLHKLAQQKHPLAGLGEVANDVVHVPAGEAENIIGFGDHFRSDLRAALVGDIDAQFLHRRDRMHAGRRAIDRAEAGRQCFVAALLFHEFAEKAFGHRAATNVARADKENFFHSRLGGASGQSVNALAAISPRTRAPSNFILSTAA